MNQKKNKKLIIITSILLVVLIILAGGTYAYFGTDLLKSKKELFFKYLTQIGDNNNGFVESSLKNYFDKKSSNSYFNQGSLSVNVNSSSEQSQYENTNKMKLTFDGQVDNTTNYLQQNISLNYSDNLNFPIIFKKI